MNALDRKNMNARKSSAAAKILGSAAALALLSGCVGDPIASAKVDPASPVAPEVAKLASHDTDYPSFNEIPPKPDDVRPARLYGDRAKQVEAARADLDAATAPGTWTLGATQSFADRARADAGPSIEAAPRSDTEAFAAAARKRATPPPPPKR